MKRLIAASAIFFSCSLMASGTPTVLQQPEVSAKARLAEKGLTYSASFSTDMLANPVGGKARGFAYCGSLGAAVDVDFGKLCEFHGFEFYSSVVWRTGTNLSQRKIDNQFPVGQVYGSQTVKLNEFYFRQALWQGRFSAKIGRLDGGNDFLASPLYGQYVNNAFCGNPISIFFNMPFTAYPNSTWGAYMEIQPIDSLKFKFAVYNANNKIAKNKYHGINWTFKGRPGAIWASELGFLNNQKIPGRGYPGNYKVGLLYLSGHTKKFDGKNASGDPCIYLLLDQMIYRPKESNANQRGLTPFITLLFAPINRNLFPFFTTTGLVYYGPFKSRPQDSASVGFAYGSYSKDNTASPPQDYEAIVELNYWVQATKDIIITPDFQYVIHPKGHANVKNAFVLGAQIEITL